ncbi:hypothetical protein BKA65DRAFT_494397 [Rhexocercosporidium sp. MPI-PUGE-AT-0058]|nr:hypothetical protein BKA65DRAFT_494397 [Rhexocercosporidium sp. MPI-PUGE-AT-0058]
MSENGYLSLQDYSDSFLCIPPSDSNNVALAQNIRNHLTSPQATHRIKLQITTFFSSVKMGRMMMCATSSSEENEVQECCIFRLSASPPTVTEYKLDSWPTRSIDSDLMPSSPLTTSIDSSSQSIKTQRHKSSAKPPNPSFHISKRKHRSRSCRPTMRVSRRFTDENVQRARNLAIENQEAIEAIRSMDLEQGFKRSTWYWLHHRTMEEQPDEVFLRLRRLQIEAMKRNMRDLKLKDWEVSALCLEGGSRLRKVVKEEDVE